MATSAVADGLVWFPRCGLDWLWTNYRLDRKALIAIFIIAILVIIVDYHSVSSSWCRNNVPKKRRCTFIPTHQELLLTMISAAVFTTTYLLLIVINNCVVVKVNFGYAILIEVEKAVVIGLKLLLLLRDSSDSKEIKPSWQWIINTCCLRISIICLSEEKGGERCRLAFLLFLFLISEAGKRFNEISGHGRRHLLRELLIRCHLIVLALSTRTGLDVEVEHVLA